MDGWQALAVALAVGLLVGFERERSRHGRAVAGVRTFAGAALAGALGATLGTPVLVVVVAVVGLVVVVGYVRTSSGEPGATTELAVIASCLLGALAVTQATLAVGAAVVLTVLLAAKEPLHRFARSVITEREVEDALRFFVAAFVVLPLLPSQDIGPYGVIDPRRVWTLVVLVAGIGWVGYLATRLLGARRGLLVAGFAGGFVSGAATTAAMARLGREPAGRRAALAAALLASLATLVYLALVVGVVDRSLLLRLLPAIVAGAAVIVAEAAWLSRRGTESAAPRSEARPLALGPAIALAAVLTAVLLLARWSADVQGGAGTAVVSGLAGLADAHATAVALAALTAGGDLAPAAAVLGIGAALATNTVVKVVLAWVTGGRAVATRLAGLLLPPSLAVAAVLVLAS